MGERNIKTIKIFLASSAELKPERDAIASLEGNLNERLTPLGINIHFVLWEYLDSSMGPKHKQEEYNDALCDCEMCMVMYWTKFGDYTTEEFNIAYQQLCEGKNPKKLYVYFKDEDNPSTELKHFRDGFSERYGHFYNHFGSIDTLKADFLLQLIDYQKNYLQGRNFVEIKDGQVRIGGEVYVELANVPFAGNNEEYNLLLKNIKKTQKLMSVTDSGDPEYGEYAAELADLKEKQSQMENSLWDTALMITRLSVAQCSERLKRAIEAFSSGDNKGAIAVLNEEEINRDINHNLQLIQLGEEGKKGLAINIDELLLRINAVESEHKEGWQKEVDQMFLQCLKYAVGVVPDVKMKDILIKYGCFLQEQKKFNEAEKVYGFAVGLGLEAEELERDELQSLLQDINVLKNLADIYRETSRFDDSEEYYERVIECYRLLADISHTFEDDLSGSLCGIAKLYCDNHRYDKSEMCYEEALALRKRILKDSPTVYNELALLATLYDFSALYRATQQDDKLEELYKTTIECATCLVRNNPPKYETYLVYALDRLAYLYFRTNKYAESEKLFKEEIDILKRLFNDSPVTYQSDLADTLEYLADVYQMTNQLDKCRETLAEILEIYRSLAKDNPKIYEPKLAHTLYNCTTLNAGFGMYEEALEIYERLYKDSPDEYASYLMRILRGLAYKNIVVFYYEKGEELGNRALEISRRLASENPQVYEQDLSRALITLGYLYLRTERYAESEEMYSEALDICKRVLGEEHPETVGALNRLNEVRERIGLQ